MTTGRPEPNKTDLAEAIDGIGDERRHQLLFRQDTLFLRCVLEGRDRVLRVALGFRDCAVDHIAGDAAHGTGRNRRLQGKRDTGEMRAKLAGQRNGIVRGRVARPARCQIDDDISRHEKLLRTLNSYGATAFPALTHVNRWERQLF
jgi:hypothetical protein